MEAHDGVVRAFLDEPDRRSRVESALAVAPAGRLHNVLVGVKDIIRVDGLDTRAGSALPPEVFGGAQAAIVDRVQAAGGVVAGKTVTAEFAVSEPGPTRNPRHLDHTPGGSSSGSAAAVAAGMVPLALGTQTVGSVIRPAAFCGVVGFRPTWGVIPMDGVIPNACSLDTVGLFTADARSAAFAAAVLCQWAAAPEPERLPVLGVPDGTYLDAVDAESRSLFTEQLRRLQRSGYQVRTATLATDFAALDANLRTFQRFELAQAHREWFKNYQTLYRPGTAAAVREGQQVRPGQYRASAKWRDRFIAATDARMAEVGVDLWVTPAAPGPAPRGLASTGSAVMSAPFSFAGMPAISLPTHDAALPLGVQFVAARHQDVQLLASAPGLETVLTQSTAPRD